MLMNFGQIRFENGITFEYLEFLADHSMVPDSLP